MVSTYPQNLKQGTGGQTFKPSPTWRPSNEIRQAVQRTHGNDLIRQAQAQNQQRLRELTGPKIRASSVALTAARVLFRAHPLGRVIDLVRVASWLLEQGGYRWTINDPYPGWTLVAQCNNPSWRQTWQVIGRSRWFFNFVPGPTQIGQTNGCLSGQANAGDQLGNPVGARGMLVFERYAHINGPKLGQLEAWARPTPWNGQPDMRNYWRYVPDGKPWKVFRNIHPQYIPIKEFAPDPSPKPIDMIPKWPRDPLGNSTNGNEVPDSDPDTKPDPRLSRPHTVRPPRYGEREKKFAGSPQTVQEFFKFISKLKEGTTEYKDFLENIIESMPKELQKVPKKGKFATIQEMLQHIWKNLDKVDGYELWKNLALNYLEDKAVGAAIAASDKAAKRIGSSATTAVRGSWLHFRNNLPRW